MSDVSAPTRHDLLRTVAEGTAGATGEAYLQRLVRRVGAAFGGTCWVAEALERGRSAHVLSCWPPDQLPFAGEFPLQDAFAGSRAVETHDADGEVNGWLVLDGAVELSPDEVTAMGIFAARVGAELDRRRQESRLREREAEILASRARVVEAADAERRRIGRDLHDGVQQRLVAIIQRLDLAARAERPADFIGAAREQAAGAAQELRDLAHGLHPVGLSERGIEGALQIMAARSDLPLIVEALPERRLPAPIELTVYYLVSEALANAVKHARASRLTVSAELAARALRVVIADDGVGGATDARAGTGLRGLRDRVTNLGGELLVDSPPGQGTRLEATIPLAPFRDERDPFIEFGFEGDGGLGQRMAEQVLAGTKRATISLAREWDLEGGPPRIGQELPVLDHTGRRYCTVVVTHTTTIPFHLVDDDIATLAHGEPLTAEQWRANRFRFYEGCRDEIAVLLGEPDWQLTETEPMVIVHFRLLGS